MPDPFNIYCDESCHLEHDEHRVMLLGALRCPRDQVRPVSLALREIKKRWRATAEMKWVKVSPSRIGFYEEVLGFFFKTGWKWRNAFGILSNEEKGREC
jgi:hypothetical protein